MDEGRQYLTRLSVLEATQALEGRSAVDPNVIGGNSYYAMYFEADRKWASVSAGGGHMSMREITDPARIAELNDARDVRLERQEKRTQFHPDDPYRTITRSPLTAAVDDVPDPAQVATRLADIGPGHREYALMQQVREGVAAIDAPGVPDENSERLVASVMALARHNQLERADHVLLSARTADHPAGRNVFVVQGELNDPAHLRASMPTDRAVQTPVEQSLQALQAVGADREQARAAPAGGRCAGARHPGDTDGLGSRPVAASPHAVFATRCAGIAEFAWRPTRTSRVDVRLGGCHFTAAVAAHFGGHSGPGAR